MLSATCHCGAVGIEIPNRPDVVTNCNCSICRRLGTLWAYFDADSVSISGHPQHTQTYIQGDKTLQVVRCQSCGCTLLWEPLQRKPGSRVGVNIRNFDPEAIGDVRIQLLDGADTWKVFSWDDLQ